MKGNSAGTGWAGGCLVAALLAAPTGAQEVDRGRAATEAGNQAAEADRLFKLGEFDAALPLYRAERGSRAATGDLRYEAYALRAIGLCLAELGDDQGAIEAWRQARPLDLKRDDPGYVGYDDFLIAQAQGRLGETAAAVQTLREALPRLSGAADRDHETDARLALTRLLVGSGRAAEAREHATRALDLARGAKDSWRVADALASSGQVEGSTGDPAKALDLFAQAQHAFEEQGRAADSAWMETTSASTLVLLDKPDQAKARYERAATLHRDLRDGGSAAEDLTALAGLHLQAGQIEAGLKAAREAVDQAAEADDRPREVEARVRLAQIFGFRNEWAKAAEVLDEAVILGRQVARDDPAEQVRILVTAALTDARAELKDRAAERIKVAEALAADPKAPAFLKQAVADAARSVHAPPLSRQRSKAAGDRISSRPDSAKSATSRRFKPSGWSRARHRRRRRREPLRPFWSGRR